MDEQKISTNGNIEVVLGDVRWYRDSAEVRDVRGRAWRGGFSFDAAELRAIYDGSSSDVVGCEGAVSNEVLADVV